VVKSLKIVIQDRELTHGAERLAVAREMDGPVRIENDGEISKLGKKVRGMELTTPSVSRQSCHHHDLAMMLKNMFRDAILRVQLHDTMKPPFIPELSRSKPSNF
jgi:hypothetical protein